MYDRHYDTDDRSSFNPHTNAHNYNRPTAVQPAWLSQDPNPGPYVPPDYAAVRGRPKASPGRTASAARPLRTSLSMGFESLARRASASSWARPSSAAPHRPSRASGDSLPTNAGPGNDTRDDIRSSAVQTRDATALELRRTWTSSSGDLRLLAEPDPNTDRNSYMNMYNRLAEKVR